VPSGSMKVDVKSLQDVLVSHGYLSNNDSTGYFGIKTRAALIKLQKENGIPTIGKFGPATRAFLKNKIILSKEPHSEYPNIQVWKYLDKDKIRERIIIPGMEEYIK
jgi:peptidoglycan hydrolase-like protein with peptidoglycan-binding domain